MTIINISCEFRREIEYPDEYCFALAYPVGRDTIAIRGPGSLAIGLGRTLTTDGANQWRRISVSENSSGRATIIAAVLVSFAIISGSFFIADSLDRTTDQLELATEALGDLELAAGAPADRPPSRPNRPDANKEYCINQVLHQTLKSFPCTFDPLQLVGAAFGAAGQRCMALTTAVMVWIIP